MKLVATTCLLALAACAATTDDPDDQTAESAPGIGDGKADSATALYGNYNLAGSAQHAEGDVVSLALVADLDGSRATAPANTSGSYVRVRAYDGGARLVPQTDTFRLFTSNAKTYIEFRGFAWLDQNNENLKPVVEDVYEYKLTDHVLELRKTYTSRWQSLASIADQTACTTSGGTWDPANPAPGARPGSTTPCTCAADQTFVPGDGGCTVPVDPDESTCDDTHGYYTDDDSTLLGNFCVCPTGAGLTTEGCTAL